MEAAKPEDIDATVEDVAAEKESALTLSVTELCISVDALLVTLRLIIRMALFALGAFIFTVAVGMLFAPPTQHR